MSVVSSFDATFEQRLRAEIKKASEVVTEAVMRGLPPEHYQRCLGEVAAYQAVIELCDDIRKAMLND